MGQYFGIWESVLLSFQKYFFFICNSSKGSTARSQVLNVKWTKTPSWKDTEFPKLHAKGSKDLKDIINLKSNIAITEPIDFPKKGHVMNYPRDRADLCTFRILSVCELLYEFKKRRSILSPDAQLYTLPRG